MTLNLCSRKFTQAFALVVTGIYLNASLAQAHPYSENWYNAERLMGEAVQDLPQDGLLNVVNDCVQGTLATSFAVGCFFANEYLWPHGSGASWREFGSSGVMFASGGGYGAYGASRLNDARNRMKRRAERSRQTKIGDSPQDQYKLITVGVDHIYWNTTYQTNKGRFSKMLTVVKDFVSAGEFVRLMRVFDLVEINMDELLFLAKFARSIGMDRYNIAAQRHITEDIRDRLIRRLQQGPLTHYERKLNLYFPHEPGFTLMIPQILGNFRTLFQSQQTDRLDELLKKMKSFQQPIVVPPSGSVPVAVSDSLSTAHLSTDFSSIAALARTEPASESPATSADTPPEELRAELKELDEILDKVQLTHIHLNGPLKFLLVRRLRKFAEVLPPQILSVAQHEKIKEILAEYTKEFGELPRPYEFMGTPAAEDGAPVEDITPPNDASASHDLGSISEENASHSAGDEKVDGDEGDDQAEEETDSSTGSTHELRQRH